MKKIFRKNLIVFILFGLIVGGTAVVSATISSQPVNPGENPMDGMSADKTEVMVTGKGYKLSKKQAKDHLLEKKEEPEEPIVAPNVPGRNKLGLNGRIGANPRTIHSFKINGGKPIIETDLKDSKNYTREEPFEFWVEGKTSMKTAIDSKNYEVTLNGEEIEGNGSKTHLNYSVNLIPEENIIKITVKDKLKKKSLTETYKIPPKVGDLSTEVELSNLGLVVPIGGDIECFKDETIRNVIDRMAKSNNLRVTYDKSGKTITKITGTSLKLQSDPIDQAIKEELEASDPPVEYKTDPKAKSALSNGDFTSESKWMIMVTDSSGQTKSDVSVKSKVTKGTSVTLVFSVYRGYEFDGTWGSF